ncbi:hypothetical protein TNCV_599381 [Trichonephila clavipes]|nr:hypothetical protein TNCV_599381 [Trichonephila clavipes]
MPSSSYKQRDKVTVIKSDAAGDRCNEILLISNAFKRRGREKRNLKHRIKENLGSELHIRDALYKVRACSEYRVMPRIRRRNANQQVSEFDRGRIIEYQKCRLSFRDIARCTG